ncbi:MAG: hypothetical protein HYZ93_05345 [Candidatus Omnitrophica bacterium]|nr:hypothetical protein [Candidatus Omnitrophota bacterium]
MRRRLLGSAALLVFLGGALLWIAQQSRLDLERGLGKFLHLPVHIRRVSFSPGQVTLQGVLFDQAFPVAIDRLQIQGALWSPFSRRSLASLWENGGLQSVTVTRLVCSLGGVPLNAEGRIFLIRQLGKAPRIEGWLSFDHPLFNGRVELSGPVLEPVLMGWVEGWNARRYFVAQLVFSREEILLSQLEIQGGWSARGLLRRSGPSSLTVSGSGRRMELEFQPPAAEGNQVLFSVREGEEAPRQMGVTWTVRRETLELKADLLQQKTSLSGQVRLSSPYPADLALRFNGADMVGLARWLLPKDRIPALSGALYGEVRLTGPLSQLRSQAKVFSREGRLGTDRFIAATLRFRGTGPILQLEDSQMTKASGVVLMEGTVDLRHLGQNDFFSRVKLSSSKGARSLSEIPPFEVAAQPQ